MTRALRVDDSRASQIDSKSIAQESHAGQLACKIEAKVDAKFDPKSIPESLRGMQNRCKIDPGMLSRHPVSPKGIQ